MKSTLRFCIIGHVALSLLLLIPLPAFSLEPDQFEAVGVSSPELENSERAAFNALINAVRESGSQRVIVRINMPFVPEGRMAADADRETQRSGIARNQSMIEVSLQPFSIPYMERFTYIPFMAIEADEAVLHELASNPLVAGISRNMTVSTSLIQSAPLIGATTAASAGFAGKGWAIAVIDDGFDISHPFFSSRIVAQACYSTPEPTYQGLCPNGQASQTGPGAAANCSICSHGTHVTGIAAGAGGTFSGVAKEAGIIAIQVFRRSDNAATCTPDPAPCVRASAIDIIKAMEYVYSLRNSYKIASVNLSLGGGVSPDYCDAEIPAMTSIVNTLRSSGIASIGAAGNNGNKTGIGWPACISGIVSVGASRKDDTVAGYSQSAPILNLLAPGGDDPAGTPTEIISSKPPSNYGYMSGTSMAAPHVAGTWAILKQFKPSATVTDILSALQSTGIPLTDPGNSITKPRIRIVNAAGALCDYSLPSCSLSFPPAGGTTAVQVKASPPLCGWASQSNAGWIHIISGSSGSGDGVVLIQADPNTDPLKRTGTITVLGRSCPVTQKGYLDRE